MTRLTNENSNEKNKKIESRRKAAFPESGGDSVQAFVFPPRRGNRMRMGFGVCRGGDTIMRL